MKNLITLTIALLTNDLFSQDKISFYPSEIRINQNSLNGIDPYVYGQFQKKIYKKIGLWNFDYADSDFKEIIVGPCFMTKHITAGIGIGREFNDKVTVFSATISLAYKKYYFYSYAESTYEWYWYQAEVNKEIGNRDKYKIGLYTQALIGTGAQIKIKLKKNWSITLGTGYRSGTYGYNGRSLVPKIVLNVHM